MQVITSISGDIRTSFERAERCEMSGFDVLTTQENRSDPFLPLTLAAAATSSVRLATNVAIAFPRSPMVAANVAWDLQRLSRGRFVLGLGSQVRGHNVRRFSVPWTAPAPRLREYVESIRAIFDCWQHGTPLAYEGEHYQFSLMTPNFIPEPLDCAPPPIHIAAVGPAMIRVAGRTCDGVMLHPFSTPEYLRQAIVPALELALAESGRSRGDFEIFGGGFVATGETEEQVASRAEWVRMRIGFYGSTPSYWPVFELHGLEDLGHKLNAMSKAGQWDDMTKAVDDDVLALFCARGTHDVIATEIADQFGGLVDTMSFDSSLPPEVITAIKQI
jgi:probable F420-dependent oxidoreductase